MEVSINKRRILEPNDKLRPSLDKLYWKGVDGDNHIDPNFYINIVVPFTIIGIHRLIRCNHHHQLYMFTHSQILSYST